MNVTAFLNVSPVPNVLEPLKHSTQSVLHRELQSFAHHARGDAHRSAHHLLEDDICLFLRELVPRDRPRPITVLLRVQERIGPEPANVLGRHHLQLLRSDLLPHAREAFAVDIRGQVVEERHGPEDRVSHAVPAHRGLLLEVLLDVVLRGEVLHVRGVDGRPDGPAPVPGCVDEMIDAVGDRRVDQALALGLFGVGVELHAEDAPDRARLPEDGGGVVEVAFHEGDVGLLGERLGASRGYGSGHADDVQWLRGMGGEEGGDDGAALLAGGAGDQDGSW